jgi:hypothetical protein
LPKAKRKYKIARHIAGLKYRVIEAQLISLSPPAEDAHLLVRALLCSYFIRDRSRESHWQHYSKQYLQDGGKKQLPKSPKGAYYKLNTNIEGMSSTQLLKT